MSPADQRPPADPNPNPNPDHGDRLATVLDPFGVERLDGCPGAVDGVAACSFYCESEIR